MGTNGTVRRVAVFICAAALIAMFAASARGQSASILVRIKAPANTVWVDSLFEGAAERQAGGALMREAFYGGPLILGKMIYTHGIGMYGNASLVIDLNGAVKQFVAMAGINDDQNGKGTVRFHVWLDGEKVAETPVMRSLDKPQLLKIDTAGAKRMFLVTDDAGDGMNNDLAAWGGALLVLDPNAASKPAPYGLDEEAAAPAAIAHGDLPKPAINGPRVLGSTPGYPFIFMIPATGQGPLKFSAKNLPSGLKLDPATGIITGSLKKDGKYVVAVEARGPKGVAKRRMTIYGGKHKLAMTPPMGWNSWNVWAASVDAVKVKAAADAMVASGLAAHGFQYVNIDEGWQKGRGADGAVLAADKIPDIKALAAYVHSKGLKIGIYSSPGPQTCGDIFEGSYQHEFQDALTYAKWDIDYLKYDWCSYESVAKDHSLPELKKPYTLMRSALDAAPRDIVYSLCQYGMGGVWEWGGAIGGNLWRTTDDITDSWGSMSGIGFSQNGHEKYSGPGHWNDPDMLVVGRVGWGPSLHKTRLSKNEQITHITMWSMLAAPLLIGADMTQLDRFTLDLLTNDEVLDVDQDPLGRQARRVARTGEYFEVWARPLWDGTTAVALFNRFYEKAPVSVKWSDIGLNGRQPVRDLWKRKDIGEFNGSFEIAIPAHGAVMLKIGKPSKTDF
jgi:alpha-galactosidase